MARKHSKKKRTKIIWIFCEGKTEENYFKQLISFERIGNINVQIKTSKKTDPLGLINEAITFKKSIKTYFKEDEIFCVFDVDSGDKAIFSNALKLSKINKIKLIISNPCFEYWILCHFEKYASSSDTKKIILRLRKYIRNYKKGDPDLYRSIREKTDKAIENIKSIAKDHRKKKQKGTRDNLWRINPYTQVSEFIKHLYLSKSL